MPDLVATSLDVIQLIGQYLVSKNIQVATAEEREQAFNAFTPQVDVSVRNSEFIRNVAYDPATLVMTIEMEDADGVWQYYNVRPEIAEGLINAPSRGEYFNDIIKSGYLPYRRIV